MKTIIDHRNNLKCIVETMSLDHFKAAAPFDIYDIADEQSDVDPQVRVGIIYRSLLDDPDEGLEDLWWVRSPEYGTGWMMETGSSVIDQFPCETIEELVYLFNNDAPSL